MAIYNPALITAGIAKQIMTRMAIASATDTGTLMAVLVRAGIADQTTMKVRALIARVMASVEMQKRVRSLAAGAVARRLGTGATSARERNKQHKNNRGDYRD